MVRASRLLNQYIVAGAGLHFPRVCGDMASWSDVGAGEGSQQHHDDGDGAGYNMEFDYDGGQDLPAPQKGRESSAGWSWTNNGDGGKGGHHDRDPRGTRGSNNSSSHVGGPARFHCQEF